MKNLSKQLKRLRKKPRIPGITGFGHWAFVEGRDGKKDGTGNQLCQTEGIYTTPYIENKRNLLNSYKNGVYLDTNAAFDSVYKEISSTCTELKMLVTEYTAVICDNDEETRRQSEARSARVSRDTQRKEAILIRLAELKEAIETVDEALMHHLERAEDIFQSHVSAYWKGILKSISENLPPHPEFELKEIRGKEVYENHFTKIRGLLNQALGEEG